MLRLFIAIDLPPPIKALLSDLQQRLRPLAPGVRWADPQGTHLTLFFMGDTPTEQLVPLQRAIGVAAAAARPFTLSTAALGAFPKPAQPRVLWLGIAGEQAALATLHMAVLRALEPLGWPGEARPFAPHLTLGRAKRDAGAAELGAIAAALSHTPAPPSTAFRVDRLALMRSERLPTGARYSVLAEAELGAAAM